MGTNVSPSRSRRRGVRLTPKGLSILKEALDSAWERKGQAGKLTAKDCAHLLDVSAVTARKLLGGEGVDRSTIQLAFTRLGLEWKESYCEYVSAPPPKTVQARPGSALKPWAWAWTAPALASCVLFGWWAATPHLTEEDRARDLIQSASTKFQIGEYREARKEVREAVVLARKNKNAPLVANGEYLEGQLATLLGDYDRAIACYEDTIKIRQGLHDQVLPVYLSMAEVEVRLGRLEQAKAHVAVALRGFERYRDAVGVATAARDMGSVLAVARDLDGAERSFERALQMLSPLDKPEMVADIQGRQALVRRDRRQFAEARTLSDKALNFWRARGHKRWIARCLLDRGTIELAAHNFGPARDLLGESASLYRSVGDIPGQRECESWLSVASTGRTVMASSVTHTGP